MTIHAALATLATAALLIIGSPVTAQAATNPASPDSTQATPAADAATPVGTVTGVVYRDSVLGDRLGGVTVRLIGEYYPCDDLGEPETTRVSTVAASDGSYSFNSVPQQVQCADRTIPISYSVTVLPCRDPATLQQRSPAFAITPGTPNVVDVAVKPGVSVSGKVTLPSGAPAKGATVTLQGGSSVSTGADGAYTIAGIAPGQFTLRYSAQGYESGSASESGAAGDVIVGQQLTLVAKAQAKGRVVSLSGQPLPGITVTATAPQEFETTTTDADGRFSTGPYRDGTPVTIRFTDPSGTYSPITVGPQTASAGQVIEADAALGRPASLAGTVTSNSAASKAVAGVEVSLVRDGESSPAASATTDASGRYRLAEVAPGRYRVSFSNESLGLVKQWWKRSPSAELGTVIEVGDAQAVTGIDARMDAPSTLAVVSGTVRLQGASQKPAEGATVSLLRTSDGATVYSGRTDASGAYSIGSVMSGAYQVRFEPADPDFRSQYLGGSSSRSGSGTLTVALGSATGGVDIALPAKTPFTTAPKPVITGSPQVGSTLSVATGTWSPAPDALSRQWLRDGVAVPGATGSSYALGESDAGATMSVSVRGTKGMTTAQTVLSSSTSAVTRTLTAQPVPVIGGTVKVGAMVTAKTGEWGPGPVSFAYQWKRDGVAISGETGKSYQLKAADQAKRMSVTVTASKPGYTSVSKSSSSTIKVLGALTASPVPTVSGTAKQGSTLTAKSGTWGPSPVTLTYTWKRNGVPVSGQTGKTYVLKAADVGTKITVSVTGSKSGYASITRTSAPTATTQPR